ncbi:MAG TPA: DUF3854 domain-containing protein [Methanotrichaceae archaeon]|nr:DUF3854 domain-containing protein [Methanotrichaceae archaeon]
MAISEAHRSRLALKYGIDIEGPGITDRLISLSPAEVRKCLGRNDTDSSGLMIKYGDNDIFTIRLDDPPIDERGREKKYLRPTGQPNALFIPPGFDLTQTHELWITEGELKALCGHAKGLPIVALSGVWNWRTDNPDVDLAAGDKLQDEEALIPELNMPWDDWKFSLIYDSDITPGHKAYPAFERLAEQLYRLGAEEIKIISLPALASDQKTGLDEFILARKEQALQDLQKIRDRAESYLPIGDGALAYADRLIGSSSLKDKLKAITAFLGHEGESLTRSWLEENGIKGETRQALLKDARSKLKELQQKKSRKASTQVELTRLGPEYGLPKSLLRDPRYALDELGRLCEVRHGAHEGMNQQLIPLANFVAWPVREILKDNGQSQERYVEIKGILQGGALLQPVKVAIGDFSENMAWVGQAWGVKAAVEPYKSELLRHSIQSMAGPELPISTVYTHIGWRKIDGSWAYLHAGGAVGSQAAEVEIASRLERYSLPAERGDIKAALETSLSLLDLGPGKIMYPLLALVYLAPLCEPLRQAGIEPGFTTYIYGITGSFKSALEALVLSHYGNFDSKSLPASFRDTHNSIEQLAFEAKDTLLVVDDLYPPQNPKEKARLEGTLEHLSRSQGDRSSRGRLTSDIKLREGSPPRGLTLCSGEDIIPAGSSYYRLLLIHLKKGDIDPVKLSQAQAQRRSLPYAMRGYLEYLASIMGELPSGLSENFETLRRNVKKASKVRNRHRRLDEVVVHLYLGLNLFFRFAISQGVLSQEEAAKRLLQAGAVLNEVADDQAKAADAEEPVKRFFGSLEEREAQKKVFFADMEDVPAMLDGAEKIGWMDEQKGIYYLLYGPCFEQANRLLKAQDESLTLSKTALLDAIEQKGLLAQEQGTRRVIVKRIGGKQYRVLPVLSKAFKHDQEEFQ